MKLNRKNKLLICGLLLGLYLCYSFAFSKTYYYYKSYVFNQEIMNNNNPAEELARLTMKEKQINQWLNKNNFVSFSFQNQLLKELNHLSKIYNLKIVSFEEPHVFIEGESSILSYKFSIEGSFNNVIAMINKIENKPYLGVVKHVNTIKKINYKTNNNYLITTIIIQKNNTK